MTKKEYEKKIQDLISDFKRPDIFIPLEEADIIAILGTNKTLSLAPLENKVPEGVLVFIDGTYNLDKDRVDKIVEDIVNNLPDQVNLIACARQNKNLTKENTSIVYAYS